VKRYIFLLLVVSFYLRTFGGLCLAEERKLITEVKVKGNRIVSQEMILSKISSSVGKVFSKDIE